VRVATRRRDTWFIFPKNTWLHRRSSVGIFFLSISVPEMTCLEVCISRMVGPRGSVSETTLLHFGIRVERRWNHPSTSFRWGCVLLESSGCSLPLGEILEIRGRMYRAMLLRFEIRVECRLNHLSISFRSGCVLLEGAVSVKFRKNRKNRKKSTIRIDSGGRETYFGPVNIFVKKYLKIGENISGDLEFFWNFRKFFYHWYAKYKKWGWRKNRNYGHLSKFGLGGQFLDNFG